MKISDLETYEQLQMEAVIQGMTVLEFVKKYHNYTIDNKYFIYGKRIFAFDSNGKFLDCDYEVNGDFECAWCYSLTSLIGAPNIVNGNFECSVCKNLTSLEGAPKVVKGMFYCYECKNLTSLEGAPKEVGGNFICKFCENLPSNVEKPKGVRGKFFN